jgi:hypothetical protein
MDLRRALLCSVLMVSAAVAPRGYAQTNTQKSESKTPSSSEAQARKDNIQEYINLLRADVRQQKAEIMGAMMLLSAADAAKFWPIYDQYDKDLTKLNDQRVDTIKQYARDYSQMTDAEADELVQKSFEFQKQRNELLGSTYNKVKEVLGGITAARFLQIEHQLLLITDLQIASSLPLGQRS